MRILFLVYGETYCTPKENKKTKIKKKNDKKKRREQNTINLFKKKKKKTVGLPAQFGGEKCIKEQFFKYLREFVSDFNTHILLFSGFV